MERGESLDDWVRRTSPEFFDVLWVGSHIVSVVHQLHQAGYVHRDLKPSNTLLYVPSLLCRQAA